jgi:hypothetical protein
MIMMREEREKPCHVGIWNDKYATFVRQHSNKRAMFAGLFDSQHHAQRLCDMLNDLPVSYDLGTAYEQPNKFDGYRMASTMKLFCLQENLTWEDLGLTEQQIRDVNALLEEGLKLNGTDKNSRNRTTAES